MSACHQHGSSLRHISCTCGASLLELVLVMGLFTTATGMAIPALTTGLDEARTKAAAFYLGARLRAARMEAVCRSRTVGIRFEAVTDGYVYAAYVDGNANGIRTADIRAGIDAPLGDSERLEHVHAGAVFGIARSMPGVEPGETLAKDGDPIRIGRSNILSFTPGGTATPGTLYLHGRRGAQYAVRILGATGRTRVLGFNDGERKWVNR